MKLTNHNFSIDNLRNSLFTKTVKQKDYFYAHIETPLFKKTYYVGSYTSDQIKIKEYLIKLNLLISSDFIYYLFSNIKRRSKATCISDDDYFDLEFLRLAYNTILKNYSKPDLENYEEIAYTKYVYGTTSIEGNTYSLRETELTLNEGLTVAGKKKREFYEIENYSKLKDYLSTKKKINIDKQFIKKIHKFIMTNIDENSAGEFRRIDVAIRGTEFIPIPAILVEEEIDSLVQWYENDKYKLYPIELIAKFHQKFEEIHPFSDGNGRVGREIVRIMLNEYYFPSIFIGPENRETYLKSIDASNSGDYNPITKFFIKCLIDMNLALINSAKKDIIEVLSKDEFHQLKSKVVDRQFNKIKEKLEKIKFKLN